MIVVGGGYVGFEVVMVLVCMGVNMVFVFLCVDDLGMMFCNFVIGGLGKGYFVCEVDVFDGVMGWLVDVVGI